ncbi:hypothetical protein HDV02_000402 [Globomyces sp. JEL0801]|nr:hypothetical protein HDV02_000402 [Globomyces sp. JEL0801]
MVDEDDRPLLGAFPHELTGFQRILLSRFSPLRVCSEAIVQEFAKVTHNLNVMYCYPLIQSAATRTTSDPNQKQTKVQELSIVTRLETFFPFDPLTLPKSKLYTEVLFQEWEDDEDDDESATGEEDSDLDASLQGIGSMSLEDHSLMAISYPR